MKILIGTTNPAKVPRFKGFFEGEDVEFITLRDLNVTDEPMETGKTPEENAGIKARFYGRYFDRVICNDSGLYFSLIPLDDPRQPGLNIRSPKGEKLTDDEVLEYYRSLIHDLGGKTEAYYLDGMAVYNNGKVFTYLDERGRQSSFYMVDTPSKVRVEGWPLDSLSINKDTGMYFSESRGKSGEGKEQIMVGEYWERISEFLKKSLGIGL